MGDFYYLSSGLYLMYDIIRTSNVMKVSKRIRSILIIISVIVLSFGKARAQTEIPLEINDGGYIYLNVKINDQITAKFLFDTGAGVNVISDNLYNTIRQTTKEGGLHTGTRHNGEKITGPMYQVPSITLGDLRKIDVIAGKADASFLPSCDGIISLNYFENIPFTIDFVNRKLILEKETNIQNIASKAQKIPVRLFRNGKDELSFFVTLCLDDQTQAEAEFDTGSGFNVLMLNPKYMGLLGLNKPQGDNKDYGYYQYSTQLPKLNYCNTTISQNNVFVGFKDGLIYDVLIGSGIFRHKKLTIDIANSRMLAWD
jgi:hypothetical protein